MEEYNKALDKFIGQKIKERRKASGLTQAELGDILGLSPQQVQRYESGENAISMVWVLTIAKALNIKPDFFYEDAPFSEWADSEKIIGTLSKKRNRPIRILLVEDDRSEELLFCKAAERSSVPSNIHVIHNPESVMAFLLKHKNKRDVERPDLVILDINMPRFNGIELLKGIKNEEELKNLPVIMLTNSVRSKDVFESYANNANGVVQKNSDLLEFFEDINLILRYWSHTIILPSAV